MVSLCLSSLLVLGVGLVGAQYDDYIPGMYGKDGELSKRPLPYEMMRAELYDPTSRYNPVLNTMRKMRPVPLAPTQWQMMVSPFIRLLPDVSDYCHCVGMANCGCCVGVSLKPILFQNNICANASLTRDDYSGSNYMFRAKFHYDRYKILDVSVSEREAPKACLTPPLIPFGGCAQVTNIHLDRMFKKLCTCLALSIEYREKSFFQLPVGCVCAGQPYTEQEKRGPFGLNILRLMESVSNMLPLIG